MSACPLAAGASKHPSRVFPEAWEQHYSTGKRWFPG